MEKLLRFLERLDDEQIHYSLGHFRDSINVLLTLPGERWEVEFFESGTVEVEVFRSDPAGTHGEDALERLFQRSA